MARHKALIAILLILPLAGCASTFSKLKRVEAGMTFPQVEAVMGEPDRSQSVKKQSSLYVLYRYDRRLCNPDLSFYETCDFFVVFENGRVLEKIVKHGDSYSPRMDILYLFERR